MPEGEDTGAQNREKIQGSKPEGEDKGLKVKRKNIGLKIKRRQ